MYPNFGTNRNNFPFGTNRKFIILGVPKLKHNMVVAKHEFFGRQHFISLGIITKPENLTKVYAAIDAGNSVLYLFGYKAGFSPH